MGPKLKHAFKFPNPILNVLPCGEPVASDRIISETPAVDCSATDAQIFIGTNSCVKNIYSIHIPKQFVNTLEDNVWQHSHPTKLITDREQAEIHGCALEYHRVMGIGSKQSDPYNQWQNLAEHDTQFVKNIADNHCMTEICIDTRDNIVDTNKRSVFVIYNQYTLMGRGHSIHSSGKFDWCKHDVIDKSVHVSGGFQRIKTTDGNLVLPLTMENGLPCMKLLPPTDNALPQNPETPKVIQFAYCCPIATNDPTYCAVSTGGEEKQNLICLPCNDFLTSSKPNTTGGEPDTEDGEQNNEDSTQLLLDNPKTHISRMFVAKIFHSIILYSRSFARWKQLV